MIYEQTRFPFPTGTIYKALMNGLNFKSGVTTRIGNMSAVLCCFANGDSSRIGGFLYLIVRIAGRRIEGRLTWHAAVGGVSFTVRLTPEAKVFLVRTVIERVRIMAPSQNIEIVPG